jgi:hypothetical protein
MMSLKSFCPQISQIDADEAWRFAAVSSFYLRNLRNLRKAVEVLQ